MQNMGADLLGGYIGSVGTASTGFLPQPVASGTGNGVSALTRVVLHIAAFWLISIGVLILLHKFGFRFSITIG